MRPTTSTRLTDRRQGGSRLGAALKNFDLRSPLILALARGGVPVGVEVAAQLDADLEVFVARKLGAPVNPEMGIGAISEGGVVHVERAACDAFGVHQSEVESMIRDQLDEIERRIQAYRRGQELSNIDGRDVVLVDDGMATGWTARAALDALKSLSPRRLVLAVPVCARVSLSRLNDVEVLCLKHVDHLVAISDWYENFEQLSDDEVLQLLEGVREG